MSRRSSRRAFEAGGHQLLGWLPTEMPAGANQEAAETLRTAVQTTRDRNLRDALEQRLALIEGSIAPACECGWRGEAEPWDARLRERTYSTDHNMHRLFATTAQAGQRLAAEAAAAALRHAVDSWPGNVDVPEWLEARAEHIEQIGAYDAETWPGDELPAASRNIPPAIVPTAGPRPSS